MGGGKMESTLCILLKCPNAFEKDFSSWGFANKAQIINFTTTTICVCYKIYTGTLLTDDWVVLLPVACDDKKILTNHCQWLPDFISKGNLVFGNKISKSELCYQIDSVYAAMTLPT